MAAAAVSCLRGARACIRRDMSFSSVAALLLALAVALGAFGAHGLKNHLDAYLMGVWEKAVFYHFVHALGLLLIHAARFIVVVLEHVTYLFAAPLDKILSPRSPKPST